MDVSSTILLFVAEAVFFTALLVACLKLAARNYGERIHRLAEEVSRAKLLARPDTAITADQQQRSVQGNLKIQQQLRNRIRLLQDRVHHLEKVEQQFKSLKSELDQDTSKSSKDPAAKARRTIEVGTTVDRDSGVDPDYLARLSRKHSADQAAESTRRSSHEVKNLTKKLDEQRGIIHRLENDIKQGSMATEISEIKSAQKDAAIASLKALESSLVQSQANADQLETAFEAVRRELHETRARLESSEARLKTAAFNDVEDERRLRTGTGYTVISRGTEKGSAAEEDDNPLQLEALRNYEALKAEVERLRENTRTQRQLIFAFEQQIQDLRNGLDQSDMSDADREEKAKEIAKLQRLLQETEGCVEVLESEVSYLQDKIQVLAKPVATLVEEQKASQNDDERLELITSQLKKSTRMLKRAAEVRAGLGKTLLAMQGQNTSLEAIAAHLLDTLEPMAVDVHLSIVTRDHQVDVANCEGMRKPQIQQLHDAIARKINEPLAVEGGFILCYKRMGILARGSLSEMTSLGRLQDSILFILMVGETLLSNVEERRNGTLRQQAVHHLVDGVKNNLKQISIQSTYQREEAHRIMASFIGELNSALSSMNVSDTQRRLFNEMMEETKQRMALLLESEVVIDQSFTRLIEKLDKTPKH